MGSRPHSAHGLSALHLPPPHSTRHTNDAAEKYRTRERDATAPPHKHTRPLHHHLLHKQHCHDEPVAGPPTDHTKIYKEVILDKWLLENGVDLFGLQETRQPARHINLANYTYTSGPTDKGNGGTTLLTRREHTRHINLHEADAHQLHATFHYNTTTYHIVIGHTPHTASPHTNKDVWWKLFTDNIRRHRRDEPLVVLINANTQQFGDSTIGF